MPLTCNLSPKGRWVRGLSGTTLLAIAFGLAAAGWPRAEGIRWTVAGAAGVLGAFQLFEAIAGWCIIRALGGRTPI